MFPRKQETITNGGLNALYKHVHVLPILYAFYESLQFVNIKIVIPL